MRSACKIQYKDELCTAKVFLHAILLFVVYGTYGESQLLPSEGRRFSRFRDEIMFLVSFL